MKDGDTLSDIAARFYGPTDDAQLRATWEALHAYNKGAIGPDPDRFRYGSGTMLCLQERLSGAGWMLLRKGVGAPAPQRTAAGEAAPGGLAPKEPLLETPAPTADSSEKATGGGVFKNDPTRMEVHVHVEPPAGPARPKDTAPRPNPLRRVVLDGMLGVMAPLSPALRDSLFRELGVAAIDLRFTVGPLEIAPRAMFVGARGATTYNQLERSQTVFGGGASLQVGAPIDWNAGSVGTFRILPGLESGLLYVHRTIEPMDAYYEEQGASLAVALPVAGALVRIEYLLPRRWRIAVEMAGDLLFARTDGSDLSQSFTLNVLGGLGYAL